MDNNFQNDKDNRNNISQNNDNKNSSDGGSGGNDGKGKNRKKLYYYEINTIYGGKIERIQYYFTTYRCKRTVNAERDVFLVCTGDKWVFLTGGQPDGGKRFLPV